MSDDDFPDNSVLSRDDYTRMGDLLADAVQREIGDYLRKHGSCGAEDLSVDLDLDVTTLHDNLITLVDAGLVAKRMRSSKLDLKTYYHTTIMGDTICEYGVDELMGRE